MHTQTEHLHEDSHKLCEQILRETGIVLMPGTDFDPKHGHHFVRISYAGATQDIIDAMEILKKWRNQPQT